MIADVWTWYWFRARLDRGWHWTLEGYRRLRNWLRRRRADEGWDPWAQQRTRLGVWVALASSQRR